MRCVLELSCSQSDPKDLRFCSREVGSSLNLPLKGLTLSNIDWNGKVTSCIMTIKFQYRIGKFGEKNQSVKMYTINMCNFLRAFRLYIFSSSSLSLSGGQVTSSLQGPMCAFGGVSVPCWRVPGQCSEGTSSYKALSMFCPQPGLNQEPFASQSYRARATTVNISIAILLTTSFLELNCHIRNPESRSRLCPDASGPFISSF